MPGDTPHDVPVTRGRTPGARPTGGELLDATWALLRQDRQLVVLPLVGSVFGVIAAAALFMPGYALGWLVDGKDGGDIAYYAGAALGGFGATIVGVFFQAALVIGANQRADGGDPTVRSCLRGAWEHRWQVLAWSVVTATVGFVLQTLQERLGFVGAILNWVGGVTWSIATFVVVPVIVAEDVGPVTAVKRSTRVLRDTWGTSLRTAVRGGLLAFVLLLVPMLVFALGLCMALTSGGTVIIGFALMAVAGIVFIALASLFGAIGAYARALIYRYAVGLPTPGIDGTLLAGAFYRK